MFRIYLLLLLFLPLSLYSNDHNKIKILSTTSTRDSGFYDYIIPLFNKKFNAETHVIATGTGHAIQNARHCNGDILITHAYDLEKDFVQKGYGLERANLMYNEFVIIGPKKDPLKISNSSSVAESFTKIYKNNLSFISRSDNSGTHLSELRIWKSINLNPKNYSGSWYLESGQGMGKTLNLAIGANAYTYSDISTWIKFKNKQNHQILFSGDNLMFNQYGIVKINPNHCDNINIKYSNYLYNWLLSNEGQSIISNYRINGKVLFVPNFDN